MSRPAVQDQINGLKVAVQPLSVDLFITGRRRHGNLPERLPPGDIRDMDLHFGHCNACQRVPDRVAVMGISPRIRIFNTCK